MQCVSDMQTMVSRWVGRGGGGGGRWREFKVEARDRRRWFRSLTIRSAESGLGGIETF